MRVVVNSFFRGKRDWGNQDLLFNKRKDIELVFVSISWHSVLQICYINEENNSFLESGLCYSSLYI